MAHFLLLAEREASFKFGALIWWQYPYEGRRTMEVATGVSPTSWGSIRRMLSLFAVLGMLLSVTARPVQAGYDWCSVDPTILLQREGAVLSHAMDIQVQVPLSVLPMAGTAGLAVTLPSNVKATEVLNTSTPLFRVATNLAHNGVTATSDSFKVKLTLRMPQTTTDYPVRLVVANHDTGEPIAIQEGMASEALTMMLGADLGTLVEE